MRHKSKLLASTAVLDFSTRINPTPPPPVKEITMDMLSQAWFEIDRFEEQRRDMLKRSHKDYFDHFYMQKCEQ